jgi:hypothetical protein
MTVYSTPRYSIRALRLSCRIGPLYKGPMISFVYSLDHGATSQQEEMIRSGLEARFPDVRFVFDGEVIEVMKIPSYRSPASSTRPSPTASS